MIAALLADLAPYLITGFLVIAGLLGFRVKSVNDGKRQAEAEAAKSRMSAINDAREIEETVNRMTADAARDELLRDWSRK